MSQTDFSESIYGKRIRKLDYKWTKDETGKLIEEVRKREGLWNPQHKYYKNRNVREEMWTELADVMGLNKSQVLNKWNSLRNAYRLVYLKKMQSKKAKRSVRHLPLYDNLIFLDQTYDLESQMKNPDTSSLTEDSMPMFPKEEIIDENSIAESASTIEHISADPEPLTEPQKEITSNPKRSKLDDYFPDYDDERTQELNPIKKNKLLADNTTTDFWREIGNFVALNGREWAKENPIIAIQFKAAIYKTLAEFQAKAAES